MADDSIDDMLRKRQLMQQMSSAVPPATPIGFDEPKPQAYTRLTRTPIYLHPDVSKKLPLTFDYLGKTVPEATGETGGHRTEINYNPQVSPWQIMAAILHEDTHNALIRGLGGRIPPKLYMTEGGDTETPEQTAAWAGFKYGNPAETRRGRAGLSQEEIPAYMLANPWDLGGLIGPEEQDNYVNQMADSLNKMKPHLGDLYKQLYRNASGDVADPTPKWARDKK